MADVRNIEGLRWLAEVQVSHAAQWALERLTELLGAIDGEQRHGGRHHDSTCPVCIALKKIREPNVA
jgi:hypothetical protein